MVHCKLRRKYVCEKDQKEVTSGEIIKGYEIEKGSHVMLTEEDVFGSIKEFCTRPGFKPELDPARKPVTPPPCTVKTSV